ncbi:MAG: hypothetical protein KME43_14400 [Myxacorys chilensis ATA2-1-KO14]|jgi:hypothetical protein|nr:hypothetical protein [Myxacorys chilensis ATA2-1-KO14]
MKASLLLGFTIASFSLLFAQSAKAELLNLGRASGGQMIKLDTESIQRNGRTMSWWAGFTYYLGDERLKAGAHCGQGVWQIEGEKKTYKPQSQTTRNMINIVCSARHIEEKEDIGYMLVFDPPSNVRSTPGGAVKCTISAMRVISVYVEPRGDWFSTDACGGNGWIHRSQVRAFR